MKAAAAVAVAMTTHEIDRFVLGEDRLRLIAENVACAAEANMRASYLLGVTGAMRWPLSFRPEVVVSTRVDIV